MRPPLPYNGFVIAAVREPGSDYLFGNFVPGLLTGQRTGLLTDIEISPDQKQAEVTFGDALFDNNKEPIGPMRRRVARLTIQTTAETRGDITFGIDPTFSEIRDANDNPIAFDATFVGTTITAIPEPGSCLLLGVSTVVLCVRRPRRERRCPTGY